MQNSESIDHLKNVIQEVLAAAREQGADAAEAGLSVDKGLSVTARLGNVETIEYHCDQGLAVTVYWGQRKGSASSNDLSPASVQETVRAACSIARYASEDPDSGLPDKEWLATQFPDLELYHPWSLDTEQAIALTIECEQAARDYDAEVTNSDGASVNSHQGTRVFGNSLGFLQGYPSSRHSLSCSVLAERDNTMQRDYWYTVSRNPEQLESALDVGIKAAQRTVRRLGARNLSTRQCPVLFAAEIASGLLGSLISAISGGSLYHQASFLLDSLETQIFPEFIHIHEQPLLKGAYGSASFDAEGVTTQPRDIVTDGILKSYVLGSYSARKLGMQTTGNAGGVHNLIIEPGKNNFSALLKQMDKGLLVTELMGQGVNIVSGDYSRGATGFWVENGEIQFPVEEITIAGNLRDMFRQILSVGDDVDERGNIRCGSILIEQMSIAGE